MKVCPKCGYEEVLEWRNSRFDFNAEYMRIDEAETYPELNKIVQKLKDKKNFDPIYHGRYAYYRRGTGGLYLYRCLSEDFKVPRERKKHKLLKKKVGVLK